MLLRRSQTAYAAVPKAASGFDRFTFLACMLTIAVTVGTLADYGPVAAMRHIEVVLLHMPTVSPTTEADLYGLAAMPF